MNLTGGSTQSQSQKMYKGQWRIAGLGSVVFDDAKSRSDIKLNDSSVWEGIGII